MPVTERAERLASLVGGEGLVAQAELLVPELEDALDSALTHVPVGVARFVALGVGAEEPPFGEFSVSSQVTTSLSFRHLFDGDFAEVIHFIFGNV